MSFKEKSIWVSLIVTIIIFGFYFVFAFTTIKNNSAEAARTSLLGIFIGTIILITVIQIILHIVLAITFRNEAVKGEDEREKLIELRATRISYFFLVAGVWISGLSLFFAPSSILIANIILLSFILAEIAGFTSQLYFYRRGF